MVRGPWAVLGAMVGCLACGAPAHVEQDASVRSDATQVQDASGEPPDAYADGAAPDSARAGDSATFAADSTPRDSTVPTVDGRAEDAFGDTREANDARSADGPVDMGPRETGVPDGGADACIPMTCES